MVPYQLEQVHLENGC